MKFKKIIISTIFILTIFSLFVSAVYADNSGYFLKGFADGFNKGLQMGMQIKQKRETKWKAKQLEELEKIFEQWYFFPIQFKNSLNLNRWEEIGTHPILLNREGVPSK